MPTPKEVLDIQTLVTTLSSYTDRLGPHHPQTLLAASELGVAFWSAGDHNRAIGLLDRALDYLTSSLGEEHPTRVEVLRTLGQIMFELRALEEASAIHREILECRIRHAGVDDPSSVAAKSDLAVVLFEMGEVDEAAALEQQAFESAQTLLGRAHSVTCVLAWNRALAYERRGDPDSARKVIVDELTWLLAADPSGLGDDQNEIRGMLAERLHWNTAPVC